VFPIHERGREYLVRKRVRGGGVGCGQVMDGDKAPGPDGF
jgi:hypothetical protein